MTTLPLFPLGTVLVPGQVLPLRLFEERYLALHADLMARPPEQRSVGVVLIRRGSEVGADRAGDLAGVGCEGVLRQWEEGVVQGRPVVLWQLQGHRRFRLADVRPAGGAVGERPGPAAYLTGEVTWLDDGADAATVAVHERAARAGLGVLDRQRLLEIEDRDTLVRTAHELVTREQRLRRAFGGQPVHQLPGNESLN